MSRYDRRRSKRKDYAFVPNKIDLITPNTKEGKLISAACIKKEKGHLIPLPRSGHRMVCVGHDLYVFGGYNHFIQEHQYADEAWAQNCPLFKELWKFNTICNTWTRLKNLDGMPKELASHSAVACNPNMLIYGGTGTPFGEASSNSVHLCNLPKGEWTKLTTHGSDPPSKMYGQAVCREKNNLYVVGGTTGYEYTIDVHKLNLMTLEWQNLTPRYGRDVPASRYRHEVVFHKDCLYVFGGGTSSTAFPLDKLPTFDLQTNEWRTTLTHSDPSDQLYPLPRKCHVLVKHKSSIYIQGGTSEGEHFDDLWTLNLDTMSWRRLNGSTLRPIFFHSGAVTEEGTMYLFGGIWRSETTRTDKIFKVHIDIPSLKTMAWQAVEHYVPHIRTLPKLTLRETGIPPDIVNSIDTVSKVG